jgi:hypothetical protein
MTKALSVIIVGGLLAACAADGTDPTSPIEVPVFGQTELPPLANDKFGTGLSAAEEVMPAGVVNPSKAIGIATFRLRWTGDTLDYKLTVTRISNVTQAHIHQAAFGVNGGVVVWLYPSTTPGAGPNGQGPISGLIAQGTITAANLVGGLVGQPLSALLDVLRSGNGYVNVHTNDGVAPTNTGPGDFPGGEIRGQIEHTGH